MLLTIDLRLRCSRIRNHFWRIKYPQAKTRREQPFKGYINISFPKASLLHRIEKLHVVGVAGCFREEVRALVVHTGLHRNGAGLRHAGSEVVTAVNVNDSVTVRD